MCSDKDRFLETVTNRFATIDDTEQAMAEKAEAEKRMKAAVYQANETIKTSVPVKFKDADILSVPQATQFKDAASFILFGNFGTGKTYAAYALAIALTRALEIRQFKVVRAFKMMMDIKSSFSSGKYETVFRGYTDTDFLVVDEYGKNAGSDFEESVLYEIINTRYENNRRTGIIMNADSKDDLMGSVRLDVLDRFRCNLVEFGGESRR